MKNCLVLFSLCCIHLSVCGLKLAHSGMEIVQNMDSHCISRSSNGNQNLSTEVEEVHRRRNKRYLLFEKGAAVSVTTAAVKTIVSGVPRGFNIICEESLYYDLPTSLSLPKKDLLKPATKTKATTLQAGIKRKYDIQKHRIRNYFNAHKHSNVENYNFPKYYSMKYDPQILRRRYRSAENVENYHALLDMEAIFFQQIESFAKRHDFIGRYCIMRTLCECQHFLFPRGQSLFHDVIRIIIEFSLPTIRHNRKYLNAFRTKNPTDCANLYGPHCRISFIGFLTNKIHGDF